MASPIPPQIEPRKQPVQSRSTATVEALYEASIQVLLELGFRKFTTTRVAERAGVSIGSLYQYFPNREALITAVIARHLEQMLTVIERRCRELEGGALEDMVTGMIDAVIAAKWEHIEISRALHEPMAEVSGAQCVRDAEARMAAPVAAILRSCSDAAFRDEERIALMMVISCSSLLQAAITDKTKAFDRESLRAHMRAMVLGYLREMRVAVNAADAEIAPVGRRAAQ
jgi:AcrR family transcriptional regulator